jgi:prepilin-type processing-associated H-X9-DG protein
LTQGTPKDFNGVPFETRGWGYQLLPYIEQDNVYKLGQNASVYDWQPSINMAICEIPIKAYGCPSRGTPARKSLPASWGTVYKMSDYAGVMVEWGNQWQTNQPPDGNEGNAFKGLIVKGGHVHSAANGVPPADGQTVKNGTISLGQVAVQDGTSNTIAIMEKSVNIQYIQPEVWDWWELPGWCHNADWPNMRLAGNWIPLLRDKDIRPSWFYQGTVGASKTNEFAFGSAHTGGVNALFGDGSVRSIRFDIGNSGNASWSDAGSVLYHLGHRNDGWVVDLGDL